MSLEGKRLSLFHGTNSQSLIDFSLLKNDKKQEAFCQFRDLSGLVLVDTSGDFIVHLQSEVVRQSKFAFVRNSSTNGPGVTLPDPDDDFVLFSTPESQGNQGFIVKRFDFPKIKWRRSTIWRFKMSFLETISPLFRGTSPLDRSRACPVTVRTLQIDSERSKFLFFSK